jgi:peptide-methionine (S)-S-oxide reductase
MRSFGGMVLMAWLGLTAAAGAAPAATTPAPRAVAHRANAVFAGGCFWSMETAFEGLPGVSAVISGYTGGYKRAPTYEEVCSSTTGHAEAVQITYDPARISYAQLLDVFWHNVDPTDAEGQFTDRGDEYRSEIFYGDSTQKRLAEASKRAIESTPQRFQGPIVTKIVPASQFWPAEGYHQDFYRKDREYYQRFRAASRHDEHLIALWGKPGRQAPGH